MTPIIHVEDVVKEFTVPVRHTGALGGVRTFFSRSSGTVRAVDGVSFSLDAGELVGYIGSNGAGKSTTIKMMTGILMPTSGIVRVAGVVPWRERERNALQIGVVFGQRTQLWWDLPLVESFRLVAKMYRIPQERYRANLARFVELLDMGSFLERPVRQLSLGQRMRGDLVASMLHEPKILYLDEPTIGLDVVAKAAMRGFIEEVNRDRGTTIVLTTHDLEDVEHLCRRVILIDQGRVLYDGPVERLKAKYAPYRTVEVQLEVDPRTGSAPLVSAELVHGLPVEHLPGGKVRVVFDPRVHHVQDLIAAIADRFHVLDVAIEEPDLSGVVRRLCEKPEVVV